MERGGRNLKYVAFGLSTETLTTVVFHLWMVAGEVLQALLVFNILFACLLFPLNGSLKRKTAVLAAGNLLCFVWNALFYMLVAAFAALIGDVSNTLLAILSPLFNLLWIVSFWSISLTFLAGSKRYRR